MEQLTLELAAPEPPAFANFVAGRNGEAVATLIAAARGRIAETGVLLWGATGAGKTHLLRATAAAALAAGRRARYLAGPALAEPGSGEAGGLVAVDEIDAADPVAAGRLFTLYNALAASGGQLITAAAAPPARLRLREDLRTRLAHGLVFEVLPLPDDDKPAALSAYARERGFRLSDEVIAYLLAHGGRDMPTLLATLVALDRRSLATRRPVTVPLLRAWLQRDAGPGASGNRTQGRDA
jgi:DnaA family protein